MNNYSEFLTEQRNEKSANIDEMTPREIVALINDEDKGVAYAVEKQLDNIAQAVALATECLRNGGRLFYVGAGTSGRLGVVDAAECPPTYGTSPELIQAIMAGGDEAVIHAGEGNEDDPDASVAELKKRGFCAKDCCFGMSASGSAAFVQSALKYAKSLGALTLAYSCHEGSPLRALAEVSIIPLVGAEVISGSTRMKAATAQKMVLTMFSTAVMVGLGKVKGNLMVCMKPSNKKLVERAVRMIVEETGAAETAVRQTLEANGFDIKKTICDLSSKK